MKKYFCLLFFIILFSNCFSQVNYTVNLIDNNEEYSWKSKLDKLLINPPSYFVASHLKLISYKLLSNDEMQVHDFLKMPIEGNQLFPEMKQLSREELVKKEKENYKFETYLNLIPFSEMSSKEQYLKIGEKFYFISELFHNPKPSSIIKLEWKYKDKLFSTYCVVSGSQFVYDYILSNAYEVRKVN